ncbi:MAG: hypothetical protein L0Y35_09340 [Flammeovirgaceae bacterium]|nr:hypothetical protein [Flammeovirgaceae bacterium]
MRKIWQYIRNQVTEEFKPWYFVSILLFLSTCLFINYQLDFEDSIIDSYQHFYQAFFYFLTYCFGYYGTVFIYLRFYPEKKSIISGPFWIKSIFILALHSLDRSQPYLNQLTKSIVEPPVLFWIDKVVFRASSLLFVIVPILGFYYLKEKDGLYYGLHSKKFDFKPYLLLLLLMIPLIILPLLGNPFRISIPCIRVLTHT